MHRIPLYGRRGVIRAYTVVDDEDAAFAQSRRWHLKAGYAADGQCRFMHRELLGLVKGDGIEVDHIDGNPLNNRRSNLRACTHAENQRNRQGPTRRGTSGFRGVTLDKRTNISKRWIAQVGHQGRNHFLGRFATAEEAGRVAAEFRASL